MSAADPNSLPNAKAWNPLWMLLIAAVLTATASYAVWDVTRARATAQARVELEQRVSQIDIKIRERMQDYASALIGMSALFTSSGPVDRTQWQNQFKLLRIEEKYPGFQGIGYAPQIPYAARAQVERMLRNAGASNPVLRPEGERDIYAPVLYLEPAIERHARAIGYDIYQDPVRRSAMNFARDQGRAIITGKLVLSQEAQEEQQQPGFVLYQPVYRRGAAISSEAERRDAIEGYVFSSFRTLNLMRGIFDELSDIRIELFDGRLQQESHQLYDSVRARGAKPPATTPMFQTLSAIPVHGRTWTLRVSTLPGFESRINTTGPMIATIYTIAVCLLLFALIWLLHTRRQHATQLAQRTTEQLIESRERLALALDGSNLALLDWNVTTGQVQLSERWNVILGGAAQATTITIGALEQMVHPEDVKSLRAQLNAVVDGSAPRYSVEHRVKSHDGSWRWVLSRGKVMERDAQRYALRVVGTYADISRRKDVERMKNEFIATVNHELRTPLTSIIGSLGLLRKGALGQMPTSAQRFLDMAHQSGERLSLLVNNMLDLEKLESGNMEFRIEPVPLAPLLADALSANAAVVQKTGVRLELAPLSGPLSVLADRERMLQVLGNLLSNAAKFAPPDSTVTLAAQAGDGYVRISVTDRGPGVPPEFAEHMFSKFAQADGSSTRETGGPGLGLAISKAIVEKMNGEIGHISGPESGATFYVDLPPAAAH